MPAPVPPAPDDPAQLGPFLLRGRWQHDEVGTVYQAVAPDGRAVAVVALGPGPSRDAAARDRFAAAVTARQQHGPGTILAAEPGGHWPWAAVPAMTGQPPEPGLVHPLLDAVTPRVGVGAAQRGPSFSPHWAGARRLTPPPPPAPAPETPSRRGLWIVLALLLVLLLLLVIALLNLRGDDEPPDPFATPGPTSSGPTEPTEPTEPSTPSPGPTAPGPTAPLQNGPGVSGPSFGPQDETSEMRLEGLTFGFRTPATWGCLRSDGAVPPAVRWVCLDDRWLLEERPGNPPGGIIHAQPCPAPCGEPQWQALRDEHAPDAAWRLVDVATVVSEDVDPGTGEFRIRMSHVFSATPDGSLDTHVFVRMTAPPGFEDDVRKVVNDIRANTP
ncbi:MAG TPA: hypothetical protein VFD41_08735 [Actinomycetales bacterium]|nr:hypothetical protein [Actinomycetales bacterium]